jgi:hypothetical protein
MPTTTKDAFIKRSVSVGISHALFDKLFMITAPMCCVLVHLLTIYAVYATCQGHQSSLAKVARGIIGLAVLGSSTALCLIPFWPYGYRPLRWSMITRVAVFMALAAIAYMTQRVLLRRVGWCRLTPAAGLDAACWLGWSSGRQQCTWGQD